MITEEEVYVCENCINGHEDRSLGEDAMTVAQWKAKGFWTVIEGGRAKWGHA